ncbi:MAG: serine protein kinase PrkA [Planctomycetes bacterium]|nr:serine protein kinase PrkA [Planctomycetota bacterium]
MDVDSFLESVRSEVRERFESSERVISFQRFLQDFLAAPHLYLRSAAQYMVEMFDHFGARASPRVGQEAKRFCLFDLNGGGSRDPLVGQERVQGEIYQHLVSFAKRGKADKMLLLHGPNGSGKTTVIDGIVRGLEGFSQTDRGALYSFSWIFSDHESRLDQIGFETSARDISSLESLAHLEERDVTSRFPCEQRDSPLLLIPREQRAAFIEDALSRHPRAEYPESCHDPFLEGDLCHKCRKIYESLLVAYQGDWKKIVRHVQVERFYISKRYRVGAVSIEPQGNVDAGARAMVSEGAWQFPPSLRNVTLYQAVGDIIDANRGLLEYSDFLKRPLEVNKYLLTTCEQGTVHLGSCIAYLDLVIFGTANEKQLSIFKRTGDFSSFKARMELIPVPYLLRYSAEADLYRRWTRTYSRGRHVTPHTELVSALWAVLTRLRRPRPQSYAEPLRSCVADLSPLEKAKLYDSGETPERLSDDQRNTLRSSVLKIREEFEDDEGEFEGLMDAEYEGRRGVSPREMMGVLARVAEDPRFLCLSPMAVFKALEDLARDASLYDFLRLPAEGAYHDLAEIMRSVREEYYRWVTSEVFDSIDLIDEKEYDRVFLEYFRHVKAFDTHEQIHNPSTDVYERPSEELMSSIEKQVGIQENPADFRSSIMTRIAAWSLDHPDAGIDYQRLFPEIYRALRRNFYRERDRLLTLIEKDILKLGTDEFELLRPAEQTTVRVALERMKARYGYCEHCARDVIAFVLKQRAEMETETGAST